MSTRPETLKGWLVEGGVLLALASAIVVIVGFLRDAAYFSRLGIPLGGLDPPLHHYMIRSFSVLLLPVFLFFTYPAIEASISWLQRLTSSSENQPPNGTSRELFRWFSAPAVAAAIALFAGAEEFTSINHGPSLSPVLAWSYLDVLAWILFAVFLVLIIRAQFLGNRSPYNSLLGKTPSGHLFLALLTVIGLCIAGTSVGLQEGSDAAWGCVDLPAIRFTPQPGVLNASRDYWLITETGGSYYVRDLSLKGDVLQHKRIMQGSVQSANVSWTTPVRNC